MKQNFFYSTRIIEVQEKCTQRALELLALPEDTPALLLDLGCGSGLSGETITDNGHMWVGMDISPAMLGEVVIVIVVLDLVMFVFVFIDFFHLN